MNCFRHPSRGKSALTRDGGEKYLKVKLFITRRSFEFQFGIEIFALTEEEKIFVFHVVSKFFILIPFRLLPSSLYANLSLQVRLSHTSMARASSLT